MVRSAFPTIAVLLLPVALAACGTKSTADANLDSLDNELAGANGTGNTRDPALMSALQSQIMVDPNLAQQANNDAVRPPAQPRSGQIPPEQIAGADAQGTDTSQKLRSTPAASGDCPDCKARRDSLTLGALAERQSARSTADCVSDLKYSAGWVQRLPRDLPLYPDARVSEAAGASDNGCALRAVSFATSASLQSVLDWYYTKTTDAGYAAQHQADGAQHVLGGTRAKDDGAFALFLTSRPDGGTNVDMITNKGT